MKKLFAMLLSAVFVFNFASCRKMGDISPDMSVSEKSYSDAEIVEALKKAELFYDEWVYIGKYANNQPISIVSDSGILRSSVIHDEIKTPKQLEDTVRSLFTDETAQGYLDFFDAKLQDGELYINYHQGYEGRFFSAYDHKVEKLDSKTYIVTVYMEEFVNGDNLISQVLCKAENGKLLFEDYKDSEYADDENFRRYFSL